MKSTMKIQFCGQGHYNLKINFQYKPLSGKKKVAKVSSHMQKQLSPHWWVQWWYIQTVIHPTKNLYISTIEKKNVCPLDVLNLEVQEIWKRKETLKT